MANLPAGGPSDLPRVGALKASLANSDVDARMITGNLVA